VKPTPKPTEAVATQSSGQLGVSKETPLGKVIAEALLAAKNGVGRSLCYPSSSFFEANVKIIETAVETHQRERERGLRELVEKWREQAKYYSGNMLFAVNRCADELEAALASISIEIEQNASCKMDQH
jgi:hypothetical protein